MWFPRKRKPTGTLIYLEIFGINQVIYRMTADITRKKGKIFWSYGILLEDVRTGSRACIDHFSDDLDATACFVRRLAQLRIAPHQLSHAALHQLRQRIPAT